jgi:putative (di)nucleoside polyphosphate hydrolase
MLHPKKALKKKATSSGTLHLCHATGIGHWDIPKGIQDPGESSVQAARRELWELTGLEFDEALFDDMGCFAYRSDQRLHLCKVRALGDLDILGHLICTSHFPIA